MEPSKYRLETIHERCFRLSTPDGSWTEYFPSVEAAVHHLHVSPEARGARVDVVTEMGEVFLVISPG